MKLYDTLTEKLIEFDPQKVSIYNCGPTVYNHIHIGNARPLITFDVLYRYLLHINSDVKYILNITDIDDKIINKAIEENKTEKEISEYYYQAYLEVKKQLNTLEMINPKVSDNIPEIISYIERLVDLGYGYIENGDVYFDTNKINQYGCLSKNKTEELVSGTRVSVSDNKHSSNDFVLWKKTDKGIKWETKWGLGRPGWHTECSCLINKYVGDHVSIHGGGMDLKFPHHENENAQNIALKNRNLADIWLHVGMINIDNQKMSKSLNNFVLVKDILLKYSYQALRWFFYQTNFNNPLNYSIEIMDRMENDINKIQKCISQAKTKFILNAIEFKTDTTIVDNELIQSIENNLSLANCVTAIYKLMKELNSFINQKDYSKAVIHLNLLINSLRILGIEFDDIYLDSNLIKEIKEYKLALDKKDYTQSDLLRANLINKGLL